MKYIPSNVNGWNTAFFGGLFNDRGEHLYGKDICYKYLEYKAEETSQY